MDSYAGRVCEVLAANSEPASVVGGIVATQAVARCPERVAALVYVAAFLTKSDGRTDSFRLARRWAESTADYIKTRDISGAGRGLLNVSGVEGLTWHQALGLRVDSVENRIQSFRNTR